MEIDRFQLVIKLYIRSLHAFILFLLLHATAVEDEP